MTHARAELRWETERDLFAASAGAVFVEYLIVMALLGLAAISALVAVGPEIVRQYSTQRAALYEPYP